MIGLFDEVDARKKQAVKASFPRRFVRHFAWAYEHWLAHPDTWLGLAGPVLDEDGWITWDGHSRVCPIHLLHRLARFDGRRGIRRSEQDLLIFIERHWLTKITKEVAAS